MKRVRCPKCDSFITFDETKYQDNQSLIFECPDCGKQFGIRIGTTKLINRQAEISAEIRPEDSNFGNIVVIENTFHFKQTIPLSMGDNTIGRYTKSNKAGCLIETSDPSMDMLHCIINVSNDKFGNLKYVLRDGPSNTGTFVDNEILGDRERRVIQHGSLFTIGATSIILHTAQNTL